MPLSCSLAAQTISRLGKAGAGVGLCCTAMVSNFQMEDWQWLLSGAVVNRGLPSFAELHRVARRDSGLRAARLGGLGADEASASPRTQRDQDTWIDRI